MVFIPTLTHEQAPAESQEVYADFIRRMQFPAPPNFIMTQGHSPSTVQGTWDLLRNVLLGGQIPRWQKELIIVAISKDRDCRYCYAAHLACCRMLGVESGTIDHIVRDPPNIPNARLRAMVLFALKCSRNPQGLTEDDFKSVRAEGLTQGEIVELIGMTGLAVYLNIMADATGMENDTMFSGTQA